MKKKLKFINVLLIISFSLIFINILTDVFLPKKKILDNPVNEKEVEKMFLSVMNDYGIKSEWIRKAPKEKKSSDSIIYVTIPKSIPTTEIISDLKLNLSERDAEVISDEIKIDGDARVSVFSGKLLKFEVEMILQDSLNRDRNSIALILEGLNENSGENLLEVLKSSVTSTILLDVNENNIASVKTIKTFGKHYAVVINDDIEGDKYLLETEYTKQRLTDAIRSIFTDFGDASLFFIDENCSVYKSGIYEHVKKEFEKRNIVLHKLGNLINLKDKEKDDINSLFNFYCNNENYKNGFPVLISYEDFMNLQPSIIKYKKKGNEFIYASMILANKELMRN
ncbi:MAG: hypothetical protein GXX85_04855 [Ignavibacteria bacterium]|nr:hypothetical protein [Ignavibacteria bacterium]